MERKSDSSDGEEKGVSSAFNLNSLMRRSGNWTRLWGWWGRLRGSRCCVGCLERRWSSSKRRGPVDGPRSHRKMVLPTVFSFLESFGSWRQPWPNFFIYPHFYSVRILARLLLKYCIYPPLFATSRGNHSYPQVIRIAWGLNCQWDQRISMMADIDVRKDVDRFGMR